MTTAKERAEQAEKDNAAALAAAGVAEGGEEKPRGKIINIPETPGAKPNPRKTIKQRRAEVEAEWNQWVADGQIFSDSGALAHNDGDKVPLQNVIDNDYEELGQVRRPDGWNEG